MLYKFPYGIVWYVTGKRQNPLFLMSDLIYLKSCGDLTEQSS